MKFSKKIVISIIILNIVFAGLVFAVFWHTGAEPMTLTGCWFGFTTAELWSLASIKKTEEKNDDEN